MATETETFVTDVAFGEDVIATTVTSSGAAVEGWLQEIRSVYGGELVVGLDVEWRPSYSPAQNPVALLQLCVGRRCLILQLLQADHVPQALGMFLAEPGFRFVGVGVEEDAERLSDDHDLKVANTVDLRGLAAEGMLMPELRQAGLQARGARRHGGQSPEATEGEDGPVGRLLPLPRADPVRLHRRLRLLRGWPEAAHRRPLVIDRGDGRGESCKLAFLTQARPSVFRFSSCSRNVRQGFRNIFRDG